MSLRQPVCSGIFPPPSRSSSGSTDQLYKLIQPHIMIPRIDPQKLLAMSIRVRRPVDAGHRGGHGHCHFRLPLPLPLPLPSYAVVCLPESLFSSIPSDVTFASILSHKYVSAILCIPPTLIRSGECRLQIFGGLVQVAGCRLLAGGGAVCGGGTAPYQS